IAGIGAEFGECVLLCCLCVSARRPAHRLNAARIALRRCAEGVTATLRTPALAVTRLRPLCIADRDALLHRACNVLERRGIVFPEKVLPHAARQDSARRD